MICPKLRVGISWSETTSIPSNSRQEHYEDGKAETPTRQTHDVVTERDIILRESQAVPRSRVRIRIHLMEHGIFDNILSCFPGISFDSR